MKAVRILTLILAVLAALLVIGGLLLPASARIERTIVIDAPPAAVFAQVNGMRAFHAWSPWSALDPATRYAFTGPEQGVGSRMSWQSDNAQVGAGSQEIVASEPDRSVRTRLHFGDQGDGSAEFQLADEAGATRVTWTFQTDFGWDLFGRWFGLWLDRFLGPSYERGLLALKQRVEAGVTG